MILSNKEKIGEINLQNKLCFNWQGLTSFDIKIIALVLMVLDHIHYFFEFTGKIPLVFTQLGRISAPLFLFCIVEGFCHTSDKKRYFLRIYAIAVGMGLITYLGKMFNLVRGDGFYPINGVFQSLIIVLVLLQGLYLIENHKWALGTAIISATFILPIFIVRRYTVRIVGEIMYFLVSTIMPLHNTVTDGGTWFIIGGMLLYIFRKNKWLQAGVYALYCVASELIWSWSYYGQLIFSEMFTENFQWMMAFSAIIMLMYNGKRGKPMKNLFYIFYPAHIYILYAASCVVYNVLH
ncbi:MAG: TraX family protein [Oscillospiraceae bacterium]